MAPGIECRGCGKKWRTAHEPATPEEMDILFAEASGHDLEILSVAMGNVGHAGQKKAEQKVHHVKIHYHATTPANGFEKAEIVKAE